MRGPAYGPAPLAGAAVGALALLGASFQADMNNAHSLGSALVYEWGTPTVALAALAGGGKALAGKIAPSTPAASLPVPPLLPAAAALRRDADSTILALPACLILNGAALALLQNAPLGLILHQHALCWALDWAIAVPAVLGLRAAIASRQYAFDDPAGTHMPAAENSELACLSVCMQHVHACMLAEGVKA